MIYVYTTNDDNAEAVRRAAELRGYETSTRSVLTTGQLNGPFDELALLVFDVTCPEFDPVKVIGQLESGHPEDLPPVLFLVADPADVEVIGHAENVHNQDYSFAPFTPENIAARIQVLVLLGARRRRSLESAITDKLTGLINRKYFLRRLEEELYRGARYGYKVGIILADIDFKTDGEELPEVAGTVAVSQIADYLRGRLRRSDIIARYSWSEFAVLLPDIPEEDSLAVADDLKRKIEGLDVSADGHAIALKATVGHVAFPVEGIATAIEVMAALEECCFKGKSNGGAVVCYEATVTE
jgi:diguanylate cyclase (GGDEF)-like protein